MPRMPDAMPDGMRDEKLSINLSPVQLGMIDYIVARGFYRSRSEFALVSIVRGFDRAQHFIEPFLQSRKCEMGRVRLSRADLERTRRSILLIGSLTFEDDVDAEAVERGFDRVSFYGVARGPRPAVDALLRMRQSP